MVVPLWLTEEWGSAATRAFGAAIVGVAIQYAIGLVLAYGIVASAQGSRFAASSVDWGQISKEPFFVWLAMHGAVEGNAMWITAIVWIVIAFYLTRRFGLGQSHAPSQSGSPLLSSAIYASKTALLYAAIVIVFVIVLDPVGVSYGSPIGPTGFAVAWDPAGAFFATLFVVFLTVWGIGVYGRRGDGPSDGILGLLRSALGGTTAILSVGVFGLLAFVVVGGALELLGNDLGVLGWLGNVLITMLVAIVLWAGVDVGMALLASAMQFFGNDTGVGLAQSILGDPGWLIAGSAIVVVAFVWGGYRAARSTGSEELSRILQASGIAGLGVAVAFTFASFVIGSRIEEIESGIGLSLLWTIVALGGGLIYAQSVGVLDSALPVVGSGPDRGPGKECVTCGTALALDAAFCASCGNPAATPTVTAPSGGSDAAPAHDEAAEPAPGDAPLPSPDELETPPTAAVCTNCGTDIRGSNEFCTSCGHPARS